MYLGSQRINQMFKQKKWKYPRQSSLKLNTF
jgi:hypothetical protein